MSEQPRPWLLAFRELQAQQQAQRLERQRALDGNSVRTGPGVKEMVREQLAILRRIERALQNRNIVAITRKPRIRAGGQKKPKEINAARVLCEYTKQIKVTGRP